MTFNGKTDIAALPHPVKTGSVDEKVSPEAGSHLIMDRLSQIMNDIQGEDEGYAEQPIRSGTLADQGFDSLAFMRMLIRIETEFSLELERADWEELKSSTVEQISGYIADRIHRMVNL